MQTADFDGETHNLNRLPFFVTFLGKPLKWWWSVALFVSDITSACFCMISRHYQVYSSITEYPRASLTILPTGNYNLPFMGHKIPYLSSLLVTCHQSSRLYGVPHQLKQKTKKTLSMLDPLWQNSLDPRMHLDIIPYTVLLVHFVHNFSKFYIFWKHCGSRSTGFWYNIEALEPISL